MKSIQKSKPTEPKQNLLLESHNDEKSKYLQPYGKSVCSQHSYLLLSCGPGQGGRHINEIKSMLMGQKAVTLSSFTDHMIMSAKHPEELPQSIAKCIHFSEDKVNIQKSTLSLYIAIDRWKLKNNITYHSSKRGKYLRISIHSVSLYTPNILYAIWNWYIFGDICVLIYVCSYTGKKRTLENYQTLLKDMKNLHKWRETSCSTAEGLTINMLILPKLIYRFNVIPIKIQADCFFGGRGGLTTDPKLYLNRKKHTLELVP